MSVLKKKNMIVHANCFATAIDKKLNTVEQRMLAIYISKLNPSDVNTRKVQFTLEEYECIMGLQRYNIVQLKSCAEEIIKIPVLIDKPEGGFLAFTLFTMFDLSKIDDEWVVTIDCSQYALPFLFDLKKEFMQYGLWNVLELNETNHQQLYRLLKQYEKIGHKKFQVDDLKERLGLKDKHASFPFFRRDVLEPCKKALKENTDIFFEYDTIRKGRKIHTIHFNIHKNEKKPNQLLLSDYIADNVKNIIPVVSDDPELTAFHYENKHLELLSDACNQEFNQEQLQLLFDLIAQKEIPHTSIYELDIARYHYLKEKYDEMVLRNPTQNRFGYLKTIIKSDSST